MVSNSCYPQADRCLFTGLGVIAAEELGLVDALWVLLVHLVERFAFALVPAFRDESHINAIGHTAGVVKRRVGKPI